MSKPMPKPKTREMKMDDFIADQFNEMRRYLGIAKSLKMPRKKYAVSTQSLRHELDHSKKFCDEMSKKLAEKLHAQT